MKDQFQRNIDYMRISITEQCNLHCRYCRPGSIPSMDVDCLTCDEMLRLCRIFLRLGIRKFKITGGEPLIRCDVMDFLKRLKSLPGTCQVTVTTNGVLLEPCVSEMAQIGIDGINVSVDSMDPKEYKNITGKDCLFDVLQGIKAAEKAEIPVKINKVILPEDTMENLQPFFQLIKEHRIPVRLIEQMPLGSCKYTESQLTGERILKEIRNNGCKIKKINALIGNGPAVYYQIEGYKGYLGLIEALQHNFCGKCNRIRLLADGCLKTCLYYPPVLSLKNLIQTGASDEEIAQKIKKAIFNKPRSHHFLERPSKEEMYRIGG